MALDNLKNNATYEQIPTDINFTETGKIFEQYDKINSKKNKDSTENVDWINGTEILKKSRAEWKEKISGISNESKKNIIKASKKIPLKLTIENNWNRLIEFKLWDKSYKIYDFDLWLGKNMASSDWYDEEAAWYWSWTNTAKKNIPSDPIWSENYWELKAEEAIRKNEKNWRKNPMKDGISELLKNLWNKAWLTKESDQFWMLMYLTWMKWDYYLSNSAMFLGYSGRSFDPSHIDTGYDYIDINYKKAKWCTISIE